jgi:hypothetical protein
MRGVVVILPPPPMNTQNSGIAQAPDFSIKWRHQDGSTIEFNPRGWTSDDPLKAQWLLQMNDLCSSRPAICPVVRSWLREFCELIDFQCSDVQHQQSPIKSREFFNSGYNTPPAIRVAIPTALPSRSGIAERTSFHRLADGRKSVEDRRENSVGE